MDIQTKEAHSAQNTVITLAYEKAKTPAVKDAKMMLITLSRLLWNMAVTIALPTKKAIETG